MNREAFLTRLRDGLRGIPIATRDDILTDYAGYFADGAAEGRTEEEVAAALGDPNRLARELKAEVGLKRWEQERSPGAAAGAIFAVLGLGAIDILILLPIMIPVISTLFGLFIAAICGFFIGGFVFAAGPFMPGVPGGPAMPLLAGLGIMAGSVAGVAVLTLCTIGLVNALVWYGRLHFKVLKPAIEPQV
jgi:uncharacterized membrane protein